MTGLCWSLTLLLRKYTIVVFSHVAQSGICSFGWLTFDHVHTLDLLGGPFLLWQVVSSLTSPTLDAAAPDVDVPLPFALSGASPSLHAPHKEQHFLFLLESFEWLHWWHGHDEVRSRDVNFFFCKFEKCKFV